MMENTSQMWAPLLGDIARVKATGETGEVIRYEGNEPDRKYVVQVYSEKTGQVAERVCAPTQLERG
jgi:hypothetical protein